MKRKGILLVIAFTAVMQITACSKKADTVTAVADPTEEMSLTETIKSLSELKTTIETRRASTEVPQEEIQVRIYYGSGGGLEVKEQTLTELTPDRLIAALTANNIVSIDTKVQSFEEKEENGRKVLYLDLSKQFRQYVGMMGSSAEHIVMAGLINTFLDNYKADGVVLTVGGKILETADSSYGGLLEMYPLESKEQTGAGALDYQLTEETLLTEQTDIKYPQFVQIQGGDMLEEWNAIIEQRVMDYYEEDKMVDYKIDYEITARNAGVISIVFRGEFLYKDTSNPTRFAFTYNFDFTTGGNLRLEDYGDIEGIASKLRDEKQHEILSENISGEDLKAYLDSGFLNDYSELLQDFDYTINNVNLIPTGYSYMNDEHVILVIPVNHALGDYIEVSIK